MISIAELNPHNYQSTEEQQNNLNKLLNVMNKVRDIYGIPMIVTSGLRSQSDQQRINPSAPKSKHLLGLACDIQDLDGSLMNWVLANLDLMQQLGLYFEDFRWTSNWVHFQCVPPSSGHRIFVPSSAPATIPNKWNGSYDSTYDS